MGMQVDRHSVTNMEIPIAMRWWFPVLSALLESPSLFSPPCSEGQIGPSLTADSRAVFAPVAARGKQVPAESRHQGPHSEQTPGPPQ